MTDLKQVIVSVDMMVPEPINYELRDFIREFKIMLDENYPARGGWEHQVSATWGKFQAEAEE